MGSTARPRYIGLREISERDILELYCMKYDPCFNLLFSQIAHSYITCSSKSINSSSQVTLLVGILINELCSACNAYF